LIGYKVSIVGGDNYNVDHPQTNFTILDLDAESEYTISVSAATAVGLGPSLPITVSTRPPPSKSLCHSLNLQSVAR